jgi:preprotein translocase subunit SecG
MMMIEPSGSLLLLDLHWLKTSPFLNFSIPGFILAAVGVVNLYAWILVKTEKPTGLWWAVAAGILMMGFEVVQMIMLQFTYWLQYLYIIIGFFTVLMSLQMKHKELI